MSADSYLVHLYAHNERQGGCHWCETAPAATCTPANPITAEEAAEPWTVVESVTLRRDG